MTHPSSLDQLAVQLHKRLQRAAATRANESELRHDVEPLLTEAAQQLYGLDLNAIRREVTTPEGRIDSVYGGLLIEWKWRIGARDRDAVATQALRYHAGVVERTGPDAAGPAVIMDGTTFGFQVERDSVVGQDLFGDVGDSPASARFVWHANSVEACRRLLQLMGANARKPVTGESLILAVGPGSQTAQQLLTQLLHRVVERAENDRTDTFFREWHRALDIAFGPTERADVTARRAVLDAYRIDTDASLREIVFALHTYFALVVRLVGIEILATAVSDLGGRPSQWSSLSTAALADRLSRVERGLIPAGLSVTNLFEGDVFSWYTDGLAHDLPLAKGVASLCAVLEGFAFPFIAFGTSPASDIFRELYQGLTPREIRKALGEFLTPEWLAEFVLIEAAAQGAKLGTDRVLDCTCGTGSFLRPLWFQRLRRLKGTQDPSAAMIQEALNGVIGIDINPVAVVAARMNCLMALGELATVGAIHLPVWMADSVILPGHAPAQRDLGEEHELAGLDYLELATSLEEPFRVPRLLAGEAMLGELASSLQWAVGEEIEEQEARQYFRARLAPSLEARDEACDEAHWRSEIEPVLAKLYRFLLRLKKQGRDGVWAEVIENRFAPLLLDPFDLVVGNPPWLSYKKAPESWRQKAAPLWRDYGLFKVPPHPSVDAAGGFQASDMAILVMAVALERYLRPGGLLAYVAPKNVIQADSASRAFRLYHLSSERDPAARRKIDVPFALRCIHDFGDIQPFAPDASNRPVVVVLERDASQEWPVRGSTWSRKRGARLAAEASWDRAEAHLRAVPVWWQPISTYGASPLAWWKANETATRRDPTEYTFGMGFNTGGAKGVYHVDLIGDADPSSGRIRVANRPDVGRKDGVERVEGLVETRLVAPAVGGRDIAPYRIEPSEYVVFPHYPDDRRRPIASRDFSGTDYQGSYAFLRPFRTLLRDRSPFPRRSFYPDSDEWWMLDSCDHLGPGVFRCCVQEMGGRPAAAVIRRRWDGQLLREVEPVPNHKVVFYQSESEEEVYYLAAILNSDLVADLLRRFANSIALSPAIRYLPLPPFDAEKKHHRELAALSMRAHDEAPAVSEGTRAQIEAGVAALAAGQDTTGSGKAAT